LVTRDVKWARIGPGVRLPYVEQGDARGTPVVLLPAYADSWRSFERVLQHLPPSIHAFAVTQRGHGDADRPVSGYSVEDFESDLAELMDVAGLDAAVLIASSSAGFTVQRFAANRPERTLGLVLVGVPWSLRDMPKVADFLETTSRLVDPVDPAFVQDFVVSTASSSVPPEFIEAMIRESSKLPAHVWHATLAGLVAADPPSRGSIAAPTLILWGDLDTFVTREDCERLAGAIERSELVVYPGVGHVVHWEEPARVAADIARFVAAYGSRRRG
jgi:pimeloyl-ACP methyl ester carboxylesterase